MYHHESQIFFQIPIPDTLYSFPAFPQEVLPKTLKGKGEITDCLHEAITGPGPCSQLQQCDTRPVALIEQHEPWLDEILFYLNISC